MPTNKYTASYYNVTWYNTQPTDKPDALPAQSPIFHGKGIARVHDTKAQTHRIDTSGHSTHAILYNRRFPSLPDCSVILRLHGVGISVHVGKI